MSPKLSEAASSGDDSENTGLQHGLSRDTNKGIAHPIYKHNRTYGSDSDFPITVCRSLQVLVKQKKEACTSTRLKKFALVGVRDFVGLIMLGEISGCPTAGIG